MFRPVILIIFSTLIHVSSVMKHISLRLIKKNEKHYATARFFRIDRWQVQGVKAEGQTAASGLAGALSVRGSGTRLGEISDSHDRRRRELSHQHHHDAAAATSKRSRHTSDQSDVRCVLHRETRTRARTGPGN